MTFKPNIPAASDILQVSQGDLQQNFQSLAPAFNENHVNLNSAGAGKHSVVDFSQQSGDPATDATDYAIYSKLVSGALELFARKPSSGTVYQLSKGTPVINSGSGTTYLPGGLILKYASSTIGNGTTPITFPSPAFTSLFVLIPVIENSGIPIIISNKSGSGFSVSISLTGGATQTFSYIALGV